ncbi:MAG: RsiV family protein [Bacteroidales bacterium]|nr:RsiV family protein [Bacteroidales bacterium]
MNTHHYPAVSLFASFVFILVSCHPGNGGFRTEEYSLRDSTAHAYLTVNVEWPAGRDGAAGTVREDLVSVMDGALSRICSFEEERLFAPYPGGKAGTDALLAYYHEQALAQIGRLSQEDFDLRRQEAPGEPSYEWPSWEYEYNLRKTGESDRYIVFNSLSYAFMGGAHGGVIGEGALTFSKSDGHRVSPVLRPDCLDAIQPLLVRGLLGYFKESGEELTERELLDGALMLDREGIVPLPVWDPYPTSEGLVFTYQQYEIASYAVGMPSFVVPTDAVKEFLTDDARGVFGW